MRKRDKSPTPAMRLWINERVCEGCGDCGEKSSCLSVVPVSTEFGRKTAIHQGSCNQDYSCLQGDCPSFVQVFPKRPPRRRSKPPAIAEPPVVLMQPVAQVPVDDVLIRMPGIGGTGVVTISRILQMAALLDGHFAAGVEQTGLSQKGGPVLSDLRISSTRSTRRSGPGPGVSTSCSPSIPSARQIPPPWPPPTDSERWR